MTQAPLRDWYRIEMKASEGAETAADVYIYDQIGENWWGEGVSAKSFAKQLAELDVDLIRLFVNSPGGAAWGGCCHPADCQCDRCRGSTPPPPCPEPCACGNQPPHRPFPPKGFLLPRVLASDRVWLRRTCVTLDVRDLAVTVL